MAGEKNYFNFKDIKKFCKEFYTSFEYYTKKYFAILNDSQLDESSISRDGKSLNVNRSKLANKARMLDVLSFLLESNLTKMNISLDGGSQDVNYNQLYYDRFDVSRNEKMSARWENELFLFLINKCFSVFKNFNHVYSIKEKENIIANLRKYTYFQSKRMALCYMKQDIEDERNRVSMLNMERMDFLVTSNDDSRDFHTANSLGSINMDNLSNLISRNQFGSKEVKWRNKFQSAQENLGDISGKSDYEYFHSKDSQKYIDNSNIIVTKRYERGMSNNFVNNHVKDDASQQNLEISMLRTPEESFIDYKKNNLHSKISSIPFSVNKILHRWAHFAMPDSNVDEIEVCHSNGLNMCGHCMNFMPKKRKFEFILNEDITIFKESPNDVSSYEIIRKKLKILKIPTNESGIKVNYHGRAINLNAYRKTIVNANLCDQCGNQTKNSSYSGESRETLHPSLKCSLGKSTHHKNFEGGLHRYIFDRKSDVDIIAE